MQHIGPDGPPGQRTAFTLVSIINTGALWQFAGAFEGSPTCFLTANVVPRGLHAPLSETVMLQQPEGGSPLHAGGTKPPGFWSGAVSGSHAVHEAVRRAGRVAVREAVHETVHEVVCV